MFSEQVVSFLHSLLPAAQVRFCLVMVNPPSQAATWNIINTFQVFGGVLVCFFSSNRERGFGFTFHHSSFQCNSYLIG